MSAPENKTNLIPDVHLEVAKDGVWLGFFPQHGRPAIINVEELASSEPLSTETRSALAEWAQDQRRRAVTSGNVAER